MPLAIQNRQRTVAIHTATIKRHVQRAMTYLGCADRELSVVFGSDRLLRTLNRDYRQQDRPTNVLAFPQAEICARTNQFLAGRCDCLFTDRGT